jgi:hypothetical protein
MHHLLVVEQDPIPDYFALYFGDFQLGLFPHGVVGWQVGHHVVELLLHILLHLVVFVEIVHGATHPHVQELKGQEKELGYGAELPLLGYWLARFVAYGVPSELVGLLVVEEVTRVDALPLVVLHAGDGLAQPQKTAVGVDH